MLQHFRFVQTKQRVTNRYITKKIVTIRNVTKSQLMRDCHSLYGIEALTLQHFRFVQTKQRVTNRYITNKT